LSEIRGALAQGCSLVNEEWRPQFIARNRDGPRRNDVYAVCLSLLAWGSACGSLTPLTLQVCISARGAAANAVPARRPRRPPYSPPPPPPARAAAARTAAAAAVREVARPRRPVTRMVGPGASDRRLSAALLLPLRRRLGRPPPPSRPRCPPARERLEAGNLFRYIYILGIDSGCAGAPSSSAHWARHPGPSAAARKPCNFKSKCPSLHEHSLNHHNALRHLVSD